MERYKTLEMRLRAVLPDEAVIAFVLDETEEWLKEEIDLEDGHFMDTGEDSALGAHVAVKLLAERKLRGLAAVNYHVAPIDGGDR